MREAAGERAVTSAQSASRVPIVRFGHPKRPLKLDQAEIGPGERPVCYGPFALLCYVLSNGARVVEHGSLLRALGLPRLKPADCRRAMLELIRHDSAEKGKVGDWQVRLSPAAFQLSPHADRLYGWNPEPLEAFFTAAGNLTAVTGLSSQQRRMAERCAVLSLVFGRYGEIVEQIDEVTGYQDHQQRAAAAEALEPWVGASTRRWLRVLPIEFYRELCRLNQQSFRPFLHLPTDTAELIDDLLRGWPFGSNASGFSEGGPRRDDYLTKEGDELLGVAKIRMAQMLAVMSVSEDWATFSRSWGAFRERRPRLL